VSVIPGEMKVKSAHYVLTSESGIATHSVLTTGAQVCQQEVSRILVFIRADGAKNWSCKAIGPQA
jgi:hypothetical protein